MAQSYEEFETKATTEKIEITRADIVEAGAKSMHSEMMDKLVDKNPFMVLVMADYMADIVMRLFKDGPYKEGSETEEDK